MTAYRVRLAAAPYRFVADVSVYVERGWRGRGVGRVLLEKLTELGRARGFLKLVLSAFPGNAGGMALYARLPDDRDLPRAGSARRPVGGHDRHGEAPVRHRTRIVTTTDMPARKVCGLPIPFPSRWIRTGTRWTTFTQLPVAFSGGRSEKRAPVPALIESIVPE